MVWSGCVGVFICGARGVGIRAQSILLLASIFLITARQTNAAHLSGTLAKAQDPRTSVCWNFTLSLQPDTTSAHINTQLQGRQKEKVANERAQTQ